MTHEERASLIKKILFLGVVIAIAAGVWIYQKPVAAPPQVKAEEKVVTESPENGLAIIHYHLPGDPASEQLADILNRIQRKYGKLVIISRADFKLHPEAAKADGVTRPPHVIMISGKEKAFEFQGLWSQARVEQKVDEILRGLKRVGKDWRPVVPGMTPAAGKR
jgi:hypothetical protein